MSITTILIVVAAALLVLLALKIIGKTLGMLFLVAVVIAGVIYFTQGHSLSF